MEKIIYENKPMKELIELLLDLNGSNKLLRIDLIEEMQGDPSLCYVGYIYSLMPESRDSFFFETTDWKDNKAERVIKVTNVLSIEEL